MFIHYGCNEFDKTKFKPIKNRNFVKPDGGLWASPINSKWGWKQWCDQNEFCTGPLDKYFTFLVKPNAKCLMINSEEDLKKLPGIDLYDCIWFPDFEKLSIKYDYILLTEKGEQETRMTSKYSLYGWDCECILVMNPEIVIENVRV